MTETEFPRLVYSAPLEAGELRLVALQPGGEHDAIEFKIEYSTFEASGKERKYDALSYMWGSPDEVRDISIDGTLFPVRENLWWALYYLRSKEKIVLLWIDALCINQNDMSERNYQVGQMDLVYQTAEEVLIWVGRESPDDAKAIDYIREIFDQKKIPTRVREIYHPEALDNRTDGDPEWVGWVEQHSHMWKEISAFCSREYWSRQWIIQEVMLAGKASVVCGNKSIDWRTIRDVLYPVAPVEKYEYLGLIESSLLRQVLVQKSTTGSEVELTPLLDLIVSHRSAKCLKRQDKVFGVLSISEPCCREAVLVDYSRPEHALFLDVIIHHLSTHKGLQCILDIRRVSKIFFEDQSDSDLEFYIMQFASLHFPNYGLLSAWAQINDVISYCTPSLDSLPPHYQETILSNGDEWSPSYTLVKRICYLFHHSQEELDKPGTELSNINNIQALDWKVTLRYKRDNLDGLLDGSMPRRKDRKEKDGVEYEDPIISKSGAREGAIQMISNAEKMTRKHSLNPDCKLFFTRNGRIGFGPSTLMAGDFICNVNDLGIDIILRLLRDEKELVTLGTSVPYTATDLPLQEDMAPDRPALNLHFDIRTLVLITFPERVARIAKELLAEKRNGNSAPVFWGSPTWNWEPSYNSPRLKSL